jgi:hypothetical protein
MFDLVIARPETEVTLMCRVAVITGASRRIVRRPHSSSRGEGRAADRIQVTTRPRGGLRAKLLRGNGGG